VFFAYVHAAESPCLLVPVGCVNEHEHVQLPCEVDLLVEILLFQSGHIVEADLSDCDDTFLRRITGNEVHHFFGQCLVVGFL